MSDRHVPIEISVAEEGDERPAVENGTRLDVAVRGGLYPTARLDDGRYAAFHSHATNLVPGDGNGHADILLGTQMVAKGLDFSRVTLVGVVNADTGLLLPDFRADERTFQLLTQVAGRAGRADLRGEVILQTRNPDHAAIQYACEHDYNGFARTALAERRQFSYPPFGNVASVEFRGPKEGRTRRLAEQWTNQLRQHAGASVEVLGPEPAFISRVKRQFRYRAILKAQQHKLLQQALRRTKEAHGSPPNGYHVSIDVDAVGLL